MKMVAQRFDILSGSTSNHLGKCLEVAGHFLHELKKQIKINKNHLMILKKIKWSITGVIAHQKVRKAGLSETQASRNRESSAHNDRGKGN